MTPLYRTALTALKHAYAPYTKQKVGVALQLENGAIYSGSNFENAAYMHGLDAIEGAMGALLINENWIEDQEPPQIKTLYHCFESRPETTGLYFTGPMSLALLSIFGAENARIHYADQDGHVFDTHNLSELLEQWSAAPFDITAFLAFAKKRKDSFNKDSFDGAEQLQPDIFKTGPLKTLYHTRLKAFDPLSHYAVAAMIETDNDEVFYGINCEPGGNKALHAEATAIAAMINQSGPEQTLRHVTVLTDGRPGFPCGGCRQYIREFAGPHTKVTAMNIKGARKTIPFHTLLPHSFGREDLNSL